MQRLGQHRGVGVGIAVLVAAHPRPDANDPIRWPDVGVPAGQRVGQLLLDLGNRVKEGSLEVEERVANLVEHPRPERSELVRVPQDIHLGRDPLPHAVALTRGERGAQPDQFLADAVLVIEDTPANRLGRMRRQHRADLEPLEDGGHALGRDAVLDAARHRLIEVGAFVAALEHGPGLTFQLREVDQLEVGGEGADQTGRVVHWDPIELVDEGRLLRGNVLLPQRLRAQPN